MSDLGYTFAALGLGTVLYAAGRLCVYLALSLKDKDSRDPFAPILLAVAGICYICSLPVYIILHFLEGLHTKRLCRLAKKEERESMKEINKIDIKIAVNAEHDRLVEFYKEEIDRQCERVRAKEFEKYQERLWELRDQMIKRSDQ